jgi:ferrochelatase
VSRARPDAVLLLAFGGPTKPEEIRPFLDNVLRGRPVPKSRYEEVVQHYLDVGGSSPLLKLTERQAAALREELGRRRSDLPVFIGMRHWHPYLADTLARMAESGVRQATGIILAAHPSPASRDAYVDLLAEGKRRLGDRAPAVDVADPFFAHPLFIEALRGRLEESLRRIPQEERADAAILFTAHSIPTPMSESSGYAASLMKTAGLLAAAAGLASWRLVYQSRSGRPEDPWLGPDVSEAIEQAAHAGARHVVAAPIGFLCDHVEVLYDLDVAARADAARAGVGFQRAGTVGDHPAFIRLLADLAQADR